MKRKKEKISLEPYTLQIDRLNRLLKEYQKLKKSIEAEQDFLNESVTQRKTEALQAKKANIRSACKRLITTLDLPGTAEKNKDAITAGIAETAENYFLTRKLGETRRTSPQSLHFLLSRYVDHTGILSMNSLRRICFPSMASSEFLISRIGSLPDSPAGPILRTLKKAEHFTDLPVMEWLRQSLGGSRYADSFLLDVRLRFPLETITALAAKNPYYEALWQQMSEQEQRSDRIIRGLLEAIPDTYPELFPLAREMQRHFVLHIGPTNSGKSHDALEALKAADTGVYLAPLRLLAYEKYEELNEDGVFCSLKTGEEEILVPGAEIRSSTIEILDFTKEYEIAVIDEAQMCADPQRGSAWTMALLGVRAETVHVCMAPEAEQVVIDIITACEDTYEIVRHERLVPLVTRNYAEPVFPKNAQRGDAFIVFSRRDVHAAASELQRSGMKCSVIYGNLPYDVRRGEVKRYINEDTDVVVATDAIGMGLNLPIKRIIFLELSKFDGITQRPLQVSEIKQIAGRAGRYGIFSKGIVTSDVEFEYLEGAVHEETPRIQNARIGFPYSLIGIEGLVSELMDKWGHIRPKPGFEVADMKREAELARILERDTDDKELVYRFVMFPFDEKDEGLMTIWYDLFRAELEYRSDFLKWLPEIPPNSDHALKDLEHAFKACDILYHYADSFTDRSAIRQILARKGEISAAIMAILEKEKLETRRCSVCGRLLPFHYPYAECRQCHSAVRRPHHYHGTRRRR